MPGKRWTAREKNELRRQLRQNERDIGQVRIKGRQYNGIRSQAVRMGLIPVGPSRAKWSLGERRQLKKLKNEGFTAAEIHAFELLGHSQRSLWAIRKMWGRMKLSDRRRARLLRKRKIWKPGEKDRFDRFLLDHSKTMTPEQIGGIWGVARSTVARRQTQLGVKVSRAEVMQMTYSRSKQERARRRIRRRNIRFWDQRRAERKAELEQLAEKLRNSQAAKEQVCSDCKRSWPKRREFFPTREKRISIGTSRYFKHRCVLCENTRRRRLERKRRQQKRRVKSEE